MYRLTFFHYDKTSSSKPSKLPRSDEGMATPPLVRDGGSKTEDAKPRPRLSRLEAELRFPPILSADPAASLREQLREQLGYLLDRVHDVTTGKAGPTRKSGFEEGLGVKDDDLGGARDSEKSKRRSSPQRHGLRVERCATGLTTHYLCREVWPIPFSFIFLEIFGYLCSSRPSFSNRRLRKIMTSYPQRVTAARSF